MFVVGELIVRRHIRKYLLVKLDPARCDTSPFSRELQRMIADLCSMRLTALATEPKPPPTPVLTVLSLVVPMLDVPPVKHNQILDLVEDTYRKEYHSMVDAVYLGMGVTLKDAIELFRRQYDITEDDYPRTASERCYERYFWSRHPDLARQRKRGRPRRPLMALSEKYRRRVMRAHKQSMPRGAAKNGRLDAADSE